MRIFHLFLRSYKNCLYNGSWNNVRTNFYSNCFLGTSLKYLKFDLARSFLIYHSLFKNNLWIERFDDGDNSEENEVTQAVKKKKKPPKVSVINENNREIVMELDDAQKYAKRNKMVLARVEGTGKDKIKYRLVKSDSYIKEDKKHKGKGIKKLLFRDGIAAHDLETKINQMLKLINKGWKVVVFIEGKFGGEKMNNIVNILEKSELHEFFVEKSKRAAGLQIIYQQKTCDKENTTE